MVNVSNGNQLIARSFYECVWGGALPNQLSFQAKAVAAAKKADAVRELGGKRGETLSEFHSYNLDEMGVPHQARPFAGEHHSGKHGYTLRSGNGAAFWLNIGHVDKSW